MTFLYCLFFGAGVAALTYSRFGRRVGYGNSQNIWTVVAVAFVLSTLFFYTLLTLLITPN